MKVRKLNGNFQVKGLVISDLYELLYNCDCYRKRGWMILQQILFSTSTCRMSSLGIKNIVSNNRRFCGSQSHCSKMNKCCEGQQGLINAKRTQLPRSVTSDGFLQSYLARLLPREAGHFIRSDLQTFGDRCASEIQVQSSLGTLTCFSDDLFMLFIAMQALGRECEDNPPYLVQTSAWGERRDEIVTCPAWKRMKVSATSSSIIPDKLREK